MTNEHALQDLQSAICNDRRLCIIYVQSPENLALVPELSTTIHTEKNLHSILVCNFTLDASHYWVLINPHIMAALSMEQFKQVLVSERYLLPLLVMPAPGPEELLTFFLFHMPFKHWASYSRDTHSETPSSFPLPPYCHYRVQPHPQAPASVYVNESYKRKTVREGMTP